MLNLINLITTMPAKSEKLKQLFQGKRAEPCNQLKIADTHTFVSDLGHGNPNSPIFICGEAPGKKEDEKGRPFVGRAGQFLDNHLERIGLRRQDVWVGNVLKYRPTERNNSNRKPKKAEIHACLPILKKEIEIIAPKIIVTFGSIPLNALTRKEYKITEISGKKLEYNDQKILLPTFHPAAAMRFPKYGKQFKKDFDVLHDLIKSL